MSQPKSPVFTTYSVPGKDGTAYEYFCARWYDGSGKRRRENFGRTDQVSRKMAKARFDDWLANEYRAKEYVRDPAGQAATYTVRNLCDDYESDAKKIFVKNGKPTSHVYQVSCAMSALSDAHAAEPADALGAPQIAGVRDAMVWSEAVVTGEDGTRTTEKVALTRKTVNGRLRIIKEAYRWAREKGYVSQATYADICSVAPLKKGRTKARDSKAVKPVADNHVELTTAHCTSVVKAMIETQRLTGMRPAEVCSMKGCYIDREAEGGVWLYAVPEEVYKLAHMEGVAQRVVAIGPKCQAVLRPFLDGRPEDAYLFSPREAAAERLAQRRKDRKTPLYPSHVGHRTFQVPEAVRDHYDHSTYRQAIHYACRHAGVAPWNPNQLRHARGTEVRAKWGIEAASVTLGHTNIRTTEIYAERNMRKAAKIAKLAG